MSSCIWSADEGEIVHERRDFLEWTLMHQRYSEGCICGERGCTLEVKETLPRLVSVITKEVCKVTSELKK